MALVGQGTALSAELAKLVLMTQDSPTRFKGEAVVGKRVALTPPQSSLYHSRWRLYPDPYLTATPIPT